MPVRGARIWGPTRRALIRHLDVDETRNEVWFAYGASPGIPGRILRLQPGWSPGRKAFSTPRVLPDPTSADRGGPLP